MLGKTFCELTEDNENIKIEILKFTPTIKPFIPSLEVIRELEKHPHITIKYFSNFDEEYWGILSNLFKENIYSSKEAGGIYISMSKPEVKVRNWI